MIRSRLKVKFLSMHLRSFIIRDSSDDAVNRRRKEETVLRLTGPGLIIPKMEESNDSSCLSISFDHSTPLNSRIIRGIRKSGKAPLLSKSTKRLDPTTGRMSRPVQLTLDEADQRLVQLKRLHYSDQVIADMLLREHQIRYDRKTIGTRYARITMAKQARMDQMLEEDFYTWTATDVSCLHQSLHCIHVLSIATEIKWSG